MVWIPWTPTGFGWESSSFTKQLLKKLSTLQNQSLHSPQVTSRVFHNETDFFKENTAVSLISQIKELIQEWKWLGLQQLDDLLP